MQGLVNKYRSLLQVVPTAFERTLTQKIDWSARAICIAGARGTGKSTLVLQYIKKNLPPAQTLYASLDDLHFRQHTLTETAEEFYLNGGRFLFLDEVHKYDNWEREVKNLYDFYPEIKIVVSGSSILALRHAEADLSRRMLFYLLPELSLREYIALSEKIILPVISLDELLINHQDFVDSIKKDLPAPLALYNDYLTYGAYPFFTEGKGSYLMRINQLINVIIDYDLPETRRIEISTQAKLKKLLYIISTSVPFTPNIAKLAEQMETSRIRLLEMLDMLERAQLIYNLRSATKGISLMNKPQKIFLHNTSLIAALADGTPNIGNLRETFLFTQLTGANHQVNHPKKGDFIVDQKMLIEVGGRNKSRDQIQTAHDAWLAVDNIEYGTNRRMPLWSFGFLY